MARLSREFVKLETRILNDYRFFRMSEFEQLTYIKLLGIARATQNKIPKNLSTIRDLLRTNRDETEIESAVKRIRENFPKFKQNKYFYYFEEYELRMNNSVPSSGNNSRIDEDKDKDKDKEEEEDITIPFAMMLTEAQNNSKEFLKVWADWCSLNEERKTRMPYHTAKEQLKMLGDMQIDEAIEILRESIQNNWKGIFKQKKEKPKNNSSNPIDADPINSLKYQ